MQTANLLVDFTVPSDSTLIEAIAKIRKNESRAVLVIDGNKLIGIISEGDVMQALLEGASVHAPLAGHITLNFKYLNKADDRDCLKMIQKFGVTLIPIVDKDFNILDVVTSTEIIKKAAISS